MRLPASNTPLVVIARSRIARLRDKTLDEGRQIAADAAIYTFVDNFVRDDHSGAAKAGWALLIIVFPLLGALIYILNRPEMKGGLPMAQGVAPSGYPEN